MPTKIKNIISLILLFLTSQSLLGDNRLYTPYPNNNYNHYPQINRQASPSYTPFEETKSVNEGTKQDAFKPIYRPINNAIIQTYSSYIPFEERLSDIPSEEPQTINVSNRQNAFGPPTEGMPINDSTLPLLIFSLIYLIYLIIHFNGAIKLK